MSALKTVLDILRVISAVLWIAVGVVTLLFTWRLYQQTDQIFQQLPPELRPSPAAALPFTLPGSR